MNEYIIAGVVLYVLSVLVVYHPKTPNNIFLILGAFLTAFGSFLVVNNHHAAMDSLIIGAVLLLIGVLRVKEFAK